MIEMTHECGCKHDKDKNAKNKRAGQTTVQTTDRKRNANWLQRWVLATALTIFPVWALALPDLVMTGINSTTTNFSPQGAAIFINDTIKNQGANSLLVGIRIGYYLSTDNAITTADTFLGYRDVSVLAAGASSAATGTRANVPAGLALGTYYLGAIADYTELASETDETNNALAGTTAITVTQPDLVMMTSVSSTTTQVNTKGGAIYIKDTVKNQGAVATWAGHRVGYYLSTDNVITSADTVIGYRDPYTLSAGASSANTAGVAATIPAGLPLGTYYIGAIADYAGLQPETDETNNALVGTTITVTQPDLVMTAVSSTTTIISTLGASIPVNFTEKNQGTVASTVVARLGFYLSTDNVITPADTFIGYRNGYVLATGASGASSATLTVPAGLAPGTYYLGAIADYTGLESETDETNNAFSGTTITVTLPDEVVTAVGTTATKAPLGGVISISYTIKNQGAVSSMNAPQTGYYLSTDNLITAADTLILTSGQPGLNSGQSFVSGAMSASIPATGLAPGFYYTGAIVDYTGVMPETDETNNTLAGPMIAIGLPDLTMTAIGSASTAAIPGNSFTVADTLKNEGTSATTTGCRSVGYYLSTDTTITADDTLIGSRQQCGALAATASSAATATTVTVPAGMPIGNYYLGAIADYALEELEIDEANNTLAGATILLAHLADAPTNAVAIGGHTKATVTFNASGNDGGAAITGYTVTSSPAGGVDNNAGTTALSHLITGLTNGVAYTFTVKANNAVGASLASIASNSVTPNPTAPDAPTNASATGAHTKATVTFTTPAENGSAITGYTVTASPGGQTAAGTASPILITGLTNGVAYTFTVTATNGVGTGLPSDASNSVTPAPTAPDAPANARAAGGDSQARITFDIPAENGSPITGYTVTSNPGGATATGSASPITITGLSNGTRYTFTVTATNAIGTSLPSAPSNSIIAMVMPLAYFIDTDHLDTPRQITDTAGNVVWDWPNLDPFGNNVPNENPSGLGIFTNNLGFSGQYRDKETNTFYNYFRDYDPATGRYIQSDLIGLMGGINTYTYVENTPLSDIDPLGLANGPAIGWMHRKSDTTVTFADIVDAYLRWRQNNLDTLERAMNGDEEASLEVMMGFVGGTSSISRIWTSTKTLSSVENALAHFRRHGGEFSCPNAKSYVDATKDFLTNPPKGALTKTRPTNGDRLVYDPATNTFAVSDLNGVPRTMFKPAGGINYWNLQ